MRIDLRWPSSGGSVLFVWTKEAFPKRDSEARQRVECLEGGPRLVVPGNWNDEVGLVTAESRSTVSKMIVQSVK